VLVISQDLDELLEIADRIAVMFHGRLSDALPLPRLTREAIGLLMGGLPTSRRGGRVMRLVLERRARRRLGALLIGSPLLAVGLTRGLGGGDVRRDGARPAGRRCTSISSCRCRIPGGCRRWR
jgi:hypothetical protein